MDKIWCNFVMELRKNNLEAPTRVELDKTTFLRFASDMLAGKLKWWAPKKGLKLNEFMYHRTIFVGPENVNILPEPDRFAHQHNGYGHKLFENRVKEAENE